MTNHEKIKKFFAGYRAIFGRSPEADEIEFWDRHIIEIPENLLTAVLERLESCHDFKNQFSKPPGIGQLKIAMLTVKTESIKNNSKGFCRVCSKSGWMTVECLVDDKKRPIEFVPQRHLAAGKVYSFGMPCLCALGDDRIEKNQDIMIREEIRSAAHAYFLNRSLSPQMRMDIQSPSEYRGDKYRTFEKIESDDFSKILQEVGI